MTSTASRNGSAENTPWTEQVTQLAEWTERLLVNRSDVWGGYNNVEERERVLPRGGKFGTTRTRPDVKLRGQVLLDRIVLENHFRADLPSRVIGLHTTSPENTSRWAAADIDWHSPESTSPKVNLSAAVAWYEKLRSYGLSPLLTDSNGKGGYHLLVIFRVPIPSADAFILGKWLVSDYSIHGLDAPPETFPKQPKIGTGKFGNWLRLPGRHHTSEHWSRVWDGERWLEGAEAAEFMPTLQGDDPALLPWDEIRGTPKPEAAKTARKFTVKASNGEASLRKRITDYMDKLPNLREGQGRDDVAFTFAAWLTRDMQQTDADALPWLEIWDLGNNPPKGRERLAEIVKNARAYGRNSVGCALNAQPSTNGRAGNGQAAGEVDGEAPAGGAEAGGDNGNADATGFCNYVAVKKDKKVYRQGRPVQDLDRQLRSITNDEPKRVGSLLFARGANDRPLWLERPTQLFAWVAGRLQAEGGRNPLVWADGADMVSEGAFHAFQAQRAPAYESIELFPYEPTLPTAYYIHPPVTGGDGSALRNLLDRFSPSSDIDADLLCAFFLSLAWGGPPGARPAWLLTSLDDDKQSGRGVGKTSLVKIGARLFGGHIDLAANEKMPDVITRLLSPDALERRVVLLDNVKSLKFSWAELEGLITTDSISGHRLYHGEGRRPNNLTVVITLNGASLSRDLAKRCVIIKMARPEYGPTWEEDTIAYIEEHRWEIIGDILAELRRSVAPLNTFSRWGSWERGVLSHVAEPSDCQKVIEQRQDEVDDDTTEAALVREAFANRLFAGSQDPDYSVVWIDSQTAARLCNEALGERRPVQKASSYLTTLSIDELRYSRRGSKRGWTWSGLKAPQGLATTPLAAPVADTFDPRDV